VEDALNGGRRSKVAPSRCRSVFCMFSAAITKRTYLIFDLMYHS